LHHWHRDDPRFHHRPGRRATDPHAPAPPHRATAGPASEDRPGARLRLRRRGPGRLPRLERRRTPHRADRPAGPRVRSQGPVPARVAPWGGAFSGQSSAAPGETASYAGRQARATPRPLRRLGLGKETPARRPVEHRPSPGAKVVALPRVGGLHHWYV
jgi:hypothetical protein